MNTKELQAQLDILNKAIFETAIIENAGKYITNSDINLVGNNTEIEAIENKKIEAKLNTVNAMIDYYQNGGIITRCDTKMTKREKRLYR